MSTEAKLVDNANFHIWTDALHARELARRAQDQWNRGTYVRWAVNSAWMAFEMACEDALEVSGLKPDFWRGLDDAVAAKGLVPLDRSQGIWSSIARIHNLRRDYTHPGITQSKLFAPVQQAEDAIRCLRDGIGSVYGHAGKPTPRWVQADKDMGYPQVSVAHVVLIHPGVTRDTPNMIRVTHIYQDHEYDLEWLPPGADWRPIVDRFIAEVRIPISKVLVYEGSQIIFSRDLPMRGSY